jgi:topoisomerase IA-like protein
MKYYKVMYKLGANKELVYPSSIKRVVWNLAQYHFTEYVMIGRTDSEVEADGVEVVELTEEEALSMIEEFKKSYPKIAEEELPFLPERNEETETTRTKTPKK